ncbi:MAG: glycoside hydrolase family 3 N-terminal domain-containing protein, partial [Pseudomonadota bacterium]
QEILREKLGFTGAVFSDDLSMEGASVAGTPTQGAVAALNAGCDMVLLCNQSLKGGRVLDDLLDGLLAAQGRGLWQPCPDSEARRVDLLPQTAPLTWDELMHHAQYHQALSRLPR